MQQLNFLHGLWSFAVKREWVTKNVVALVDRPRQPRFKSRRIQFLTREERDALIRAVPDDHFCSVERPLYLCAAMTGLRQGELIALRWYDVDWTASRVRVADSTCGAFDAPKNHRGRSVPMADRLAGELERHFQASRWRSENDLVFAHPVTGHVLDASKLRKRFYEALAAAEVRRTRSMGCATRSARRRRRWVRRSGRSRSGWATPTSRRPRSTRTTRRTRPAERLRAEGVRRSGGGGAAGAGAAAPLPGF